MGALSELAITKVASVASVDMKTAASTTLYTVPLGKLFIPFLVIVRNASGSLVGGTSYDFTNWRATVDLSSLTTVTLGYIAVLAGDSYSYAILEAGDDFQITVNTGSTDPATATIDVFGYLI